MTKTSAILYFILSGIVFGTGCAGSGINGKPAKESTSEPAQGANSDTIKAVSDDPSPSNYHCICKTLVDEAVRVPYTQIQNADVKLQPTCTYLKPGANDMFLSFTVYKASGNDYEAAVSRARKGYTSVSTSKSESIEGGTKVTWFTGAGTKSKVLSSVAYNESKGLIVESRDVHVTAGEHRLPDHAPTTVVAAMNQAHWVCGRP